MALNLHNASYGRIKTLHGLALVTMMMAWTQHFPTLIDCFAMTAMRLSLPWWSRICLVTGNFFSFIKPPQATWRQSSKGQCIYGVLYRWQMIAIVASGRNDPSQEYLTPRICQSLSEERLQFIVRPSPECSIQFLFIYTIACFATRWLLVCFSISVGVWRAIIVIDIVHVCSKATSK